MYGLGGTPPGIGDSRERARLAELLFGRDHFVESLSELDKIPESMLADPSLRYVRARALEAAGKTKDAEALLEEPKAWVASFGPCWAVRARLAQARGDSATAEPSSAEAVAHDPLGLESACGEDQGSRLCEAARKRDEPDLGKE
jgi:predicted Zn-dependent protease